MNENSDIHGWQVLAERYGLAHVLTSRLNFLVRDLRGVEWQAEHLQECGPWSALSEGSISKLLSAIAQVQAAFKIIRQEASQIAPSADEPAVQALFDALPKCADYQLALSAAKAALQGLVARGIELETQRVHALIAAA